ncbi:MAG: DUF3429 domain-containing protein, partial [Pseudomonadota bacterium]
VPQAAAWLGGAGVLPFAGLALAAWIAPEPWGSTAYGGLVAYGTAILSFMGGCRWGFAAAGLGEGPTWRPIALSVLPALWAWALSFIGGTLQPLGLAAGFAALLWADVVLTRQGGAPVWWPALRWPLTLGAVSALVAGAAA